MSVSKDDIKLFISEAEDLIQKVEDEVFKLEKNPNDMKPVQELYFAFHTLKGLTAMASLNNASKFCHYFESFLDKTKDSQIDENQQDDFIRLLFDSLDLLRSILKRVKKGDMSDIDENFLISIKDSFDEFETGAEPELSLIVPIALDKFIKIIDDKKNLIYKIYIRLQPTCVFKKVRLFIIFRALNEVGQIFFSKPYPEILEKGDIKVDFEIYFLTQKKDNDIMKILDEILEIENKVITILKDDEIKTLIDKDISDWFKGAKKPEISSKVEKKPKTKIEPSKVRDISRITGTFEDEGKITSVKVDINILEELMNYFSELVISKNQITQLLKNKGDQELVHIFDEMDKPFLEIQEILFDLKLIRVESTFRIFRRLVRDVGREVDKKVQLILEGTNVEIDRKILEELNAPLIHLLRNAIYHGIETPSERKKKKKDETGTIRLATLRRAGMIYIEVEDDGRGIDYETIRKKAVEKNFYSKEDASELSDEDLNKIILMPGFSILEGADQISGRGMGLAIVAEKIKELGGSFTIHSEKDVGTTFRLMVPFTRAILNAQLIKVSGDLFAIPTENIKQIYLYNKALVEYVGDTEYYKLDADLIPIIYLNRYLKFDKDHLLEESDSKIAIWVKKDENISAVFVMDDILQQMNVVVKPFKFSYSDFYNILGSTIMSDGSICLILDVLSIIASYITEDKFSKLTSIQ
ncbi:MAG: ATP-binding protein [Promethearchaeota archaeon]